MVRKIFAKYIFCQRWKQLKNNFGLLYLDTDQEIDFLNRR